MTERPPKHNVDETTVPGWVEKLPSVEADPDFRARLRSEFAEGRITAGQPEQSEGRRQRPVLGWWRWLLPVAAAAAVAAIAIVSLNRGPTLHVIQVAGEGDIEIGERQIALNNTDALDAAIVTGGEIESPPDVRIDLLAKDVLLIEVTGGTEMSIPKMPGRWFGRAVACNLLNGEMRIKTGRDFPGRELTVFTPEGRVEITGTLLSIQRDETGTCVCVLEGVAHVGKNKNDMEAVEPGSRKVIHSDGTTEIIPVKPMHRDGVLDFDRRVGSQIDHAK